VVLLRKIFPQKNYLNSAVYRNVTKGKNFKSFRFGNIEKEKAVSFGERTFLALPLRRVLFS
jgi:hypothetical protein